MPKYDLTLIIKGDKSLEEAQKIFDDTKAKLEKLDFTIDKSISPILKELAYEINKYKQGYYASFVFSTDKYVNNLITEIFKFNEDILRFLTTIYSDVTVKPKMRNNYKRKTGDTAKLETAIDDAANSEVKIEEKQEPIAVIEAVTEAKANQIDLDNLDEKLDELLK